MQVTIDQFQFFNYRFKGNTYKNIVPNDMCVSQFILKVNCCWYINTLYCVILIWNVREKINVQVVSSVKFSGDTNDNKVHSCHVLQGTVKGKYTGS